MTLEILAVHAVHFTVESAAPKQETSGITVVTAGLFVLLPQILDTTFYTHTHTHTMESLKFTLRMCNNLSEEAAEPGENPAGTWRTMQTFPGLESPPQPALTTAPP